MRPFQHLLASPNVVRIRRRLSNCIVVAYFSYPGAFGASDIVFDSSTDLWACCYGDNGRRNCSVPSLDKTIQAPSPRNLTGTFRAPRDGQTANYPSTLDISSTVSALTATASGTPSPSTGLAATSSTSPSAAQGTVSGLSGGQKVGIGVGGAIAWFTLMGLFFWFWWRRRRTREISGFAMEKPGEGILTAPGQMDAVDSRQRMELDSRTRQ